MAGSPRLVESREFKTNDAAPAPRRNMRHGLRIQRARNIRPKPCRCATSTPVSSEGRFRITDLFVLIAVRYARHFDIGDPGLWSLTTR